MAIRVIRLFLFVMTIVSGVAMMSSNFFAKNVRHASSSQMRLLSSVIPAVTPAIYPVNNGSHKDPQSSIEILKTFFPLSAYPTDEDRQVIEERQVNRAAVALFGVENARCKHGFPQAYVQYPVGGGVSSGMIRLSCPHLVKSIDEMEADGALIEFDAKLADEEKGAELRESFHDTNLAWRTIRQTVVTPEDRDYMDKKLGVEGAYYSRRIVEYC